MPLKRIERPKFAGRMSAIFGMRLKRKRRLSAIVCTLGQHFLLSGLQNALVGVAGRVVPLLSGLASRLAGPLAWQMMRLARRVPAFVAGFLPWLAGQVVAWPFRWLGQARRG